MVFSSITEFLLMGGQGVYVWSSYLLMLLVVCWNLMSALQQRKGIRQKLLQRLVSFPTNEANPPSMTLRRSDDDPQT